MSKRPSALVRSDRHRSSPKLTLRVYRFAVGIKGLAAAIIVEVGNDGLVMLEQLPGENRVTAGADKAHDTKDL